MSGAQASQWALRMYRRLAGSFPEEFRRIHGEEMDTLTEDMIREVAARRGTAGLIPTLLRILVDVAWRLPVEYAAELGQNIRYGARMLWKSRGATAASVISLGIGIGMTTSVFSEMESFLLHDVPGVQDPEKLVRAQRGLSYANFEYFRDRSGQFQSVAAYLGKVPFVIREGGQSQRLNGQLVSPEYFDVLGVKPTAGRLFNTTSDQGRAVAIVSYRYWQGSLGGARDVIGRAVRINGNPVEIVGVGPKDFLGASPMLAAADLFMPTTVTDKVAPELGNHALADRKVAAFQIVGRLKDGITMKQAESALDGQIRQLEQQFNDLGKERKERRIELVNGGRLFPVRDQDLPVMIAIPTILCALMLWIASANVATMLMAKSAARMKEIAVRLSVGASRGRLIRQLLTESVMLSLMGGALGWLFAWWSVRESDSFRDMLPSYVNFELVLSWRALAFTFAISALSGVLFGLAPALQATRADLSSAMKAGATSQLRRYGWFSTRNILILQQVAASLMLLLFCGFVVIGMRRNTNVKLGFDAKNLWMVSLDPVRDGYDGARAAEFFSKLRERVERIPGVESAGLTQTSPLGMFSGESVLATKGEVLQSKPEAKQESAEDKRANARAAIQGMRGERVGAGFFETVGIPMVAGRVFREADVKQDSRVMVVNETLAKQEWPGEIAVGRTLRIEDKEYQVIGVVKDIRSGMVMDIARPGFLRPIDPDDYARPAAEGVTLILRTKPGVDAGLEVRRFVASIDPNLTVFHVTSMVDQVRQMLFMMRYAMTIYTGIGIFSLVLAAAGLAGVTAYAVARRTKEIGIRVALGATRRQVMGLVMTEGIVLVAVGTALGFAAAYASVRMLSTFMDNFETMTSLSV
ncbi:MAG: ABC transporter permease, partial [Bryobacteraceae bacterium]